MTSKLHAKARELLANRPVHLTYGQIAQATGVTKRWLTHFAKGDFPEPSVVKVEKLYEYLTGTELQV